MLLVKKQRNKGLVSTTFSSGEKRETFILSPDSWRIVVVARAKKEGDWVGGVGWVGKVGEQPTFR